MSLIRVHMPLRALAIRLRLWSSSSDATPAVRASDPLAIWSSSASACTRRTTGRICGRLAVPDACLIAGPIIDSSSSSRAAKAARRLSGLTRSIGPLPAAAAPVTCGTYVVPRARWNSSTVHVASACSCGSRVTRWAS